jgi:hypothetical protein
VEDRDLFLAECLIWKGPKSLTENLVQLFGGATSADVRLALIAFVPERAFLCVVRAGREASTAARIPGVAWRATGG